MAHVESTWLARLRLENGSVFALRPDWTWIEEGSGNHPMLLRWMTEETRDYSYSVADGAPGAALAWQIAKITGGTVELPPQDDHYQPPPGVVI